MDQTHPTQIEAMEGGASRRHGRAEARPSNAAAKRRAPYCSAVSLALMLVATTAVAQEVRWDDPGAIEAGHRGSLDLVFEDTEPAGGVIVPRVDGLTILGSPSQQSSVSVVNGSTSSSLTLSYPVRAEREGEIDIPSFQVKTTDGVKNVAALKLEVGKAPAPRAAQAGGDEIVKAELKTSKRQPYAGEVFDVDLTVALAPGRRGEIVGAPTWDKPNVVAEPFGEGKRINAGGGAGVRLRTHAMAPQPGSLLLPPVRQEVRVEAGGRQRLNPFGNLHSDMFADIDKFFDDSFAGSLFARAQMQEATVESDGAALEVKPLPQPAPAGFSGAVGQFELESKLVPAEAKTGEPVTWTITLHGTGNWPGGVSLPPRAIPADLRTLQPKQQRNFEDNNLFTGSVSEDLVMIPSKPGDYSLPPVRFTYFNPVTETYETTVAEPPVMHVSGAAIAASTGAAAATGSSSNSRTGSADQANSSSSGSPSSTLQARTTAPESSPSPADARLPHARQAGVGVALLPMPHRTWLLVVATPFSLLAMYWLFLSVRRAFATDPKRRRREALKQLAAAVEAARRGGAEQRHAALLAWQHAAAIVLEIDFAAPTPSHLERRSGIEAEWISLWNDSDRALYGRDSELAPTWCERGAALCRRLRKPRRNPLRAFLPGNLLPHVGAAALLLAVAMSAHAADGGQDAGAGDWGLGAGRRGERDAAPVADAASTANQAGATADISAEPAAAPTDWVKRYNAGVEASEAGHDGRALAETAAAFLLQPANGDVRWNLGVFAARLAGIDPLLARFAAADSHPTLARLLSPASWQLAVVAGALLFCFGAAMTLRRLHSGSGTHAGIALLAVGAVAGLTSWACLHQYGHLADRDAAMIAEVATLHALPTDAAEAQSQRPIAPGSMVLVRKDFLGWTQVELPSGETGWVRREALVSIYGG